MKSSFVLDLRYAVNGREREKGRRNDELATDTVLYGGKSSSQARTRNVNLSLGWRDEGNDKRCLNLSFVRIAKRICASHLFYIRNRNYSR